MSAGIGRLAAASLLRAPGVRKIRVFVAFTIFTIVLLAARPACAVVVRGTVTDPLGRPIVAARVQLIQGQKVVAVGITGLDGTYEIQAAAAGRFVLLTSAVTFYPGVGQDFYAGPTDAVTKNVVLETASVHEEMTVTATGTPTPVEQSSSAVTLVQQQALATTVGVVDALRQSPGVDVVQTGQAGGVASLFVRGGNSDANKVLVDGIPAEDVEGTFDFGDVSSTAVGRGSPLSTAMEIYRGPDSVLYGSDALAGVVSLTTPRGSATKPEVDYAGNGGDFDSYRDELTLSGARQRLDYYTAFSRFDTQNSLPMDEYHVETEAANIGFDLTANTQARFTLRNANSAVGLPGAYSFYGVAAAGKQADQDIYSGLTLENRLEDGWHNLVRYGIARKREQATTFYPAGTFLDDGYGGDYYGNVVTIRGANGYTATGQAILNYACYPATSTACYPQESYSDSNRDELYYQSDYVFPHRIAALVGFRYENERGSFVYPVYGENQQTQRTNFEYTMQVSGDIVNRVFYSAGGAIEKNHIYGVKGTPRIGLAYVPVWPSHKWMHGTKLRVNVATGVQEPSLYDEFYSLYGQLEQAGDTADVAAFHVTPIGPERSRTLDFGVDQNIRGTTLVLKAGYFHNQFSHEIEYVDSGALSEYFGITPANDSGFFGAEVNSLAFRAQGTETEIDWRPLTRLLVRGGYTYLDAVVERSFSSDAVAAENGYASMNPNIPGIAIGESPFVGARPFRRPPHTGFFAVEYAGTKLTAGLTGALASRSDDSTFLDYSDLAGTDSMILPNRDLDFGYVKLDATVTYAVMRRLALFVQMDNLLSQQHIGPIGYPSLPFTVQGGLKVRIGGD